MKEREVTYTDFFFFSKIAYKRVNNTNERSNRLKLAQYGFLVKLRTFSNVKLFAIYIEQTIKQTLSSQLKGILFLCICEENEFTKFLITNTFFK